jgi:hypothetical protein
MTQRKKNLPSGSRVLYGGRGCGRALRRPRFRHPPVFRTGRNSARQAANRACLHPLGAEWRNFHQSGTSTDSLRTLEPATASHLYRTSHHVCWHGIAERKMACARWISSRCICLLAQDSARRSESQCGVQSGLRCLSPRKLGACARTILKDRDSVSHPERRK